MAKKPEPLNLADLNIALSSSKLGMSSAIAEQLKAAMDQGVSNAEPEKSNVSLDDKSIDKLNANIILLAGAIERNTKVLQKRSESKYDSSLSSNDLSENQIEAQRVQDYQTKLLEKIEENTRGGGGGGKDETPNAGEDIGISCKDEKVANLIIDFIRLSKNDQLDIAHNAELVCKYKDK